MSRYIDADEFAKHIKNGSPVIFDYATINEIIFALDAEPRVGADPIHAHWIESHYDNVDGTIYKCSHCNHELFSAWNYCPHCGARMDEAAEQQQNVK